MAILESDIEYRLSGGASNTDPDAALGGAMSTVGGGVITTATDNNLFDDVDGTESNDGDTEYRAFFVKNNHGSLTWSNVVVWISADATGANDDPAIALAGEGINTTIEVIADESTAPVGESFTAPTTKATGLSLPNLTAGDAHGIWVRRTITASAPAAAGSNFTIRVEGDTPA